MSNELTTRSAMPIASASEMYKMAEQAAQSGLLGPCTPPKAFVIVQHCATTGESLLEFKMKYHVTDTGQVTMRADRMAAEFQRLGGEIEWIRFDAEEARAKFYYKRNQGLEMAYTIADAKAAGLADDEKPKGVWQANRPDMLRARLVSKAIRMICPEVNSGVYAPEELSADGQGSGEPGAAGSAPKGEPRKVSADAAKAAVERVVDVVDAEAVDVVGGACEPTESAPSPFTKVSKPDDGTHPVTGFDYSVCPKPGKLHGVKWADMPLDVLEIAKGMKDSTMEPEHYAAINAAIEKKQQTGE